MDSPNLTPIIQILENVVNIVDFEQPIGETTYDQKQLTYFSDSEQPSPLNTMFGNPPPPIDVSSGKGSSSSELETEEVDFITSLGLKHVTLSHVFTRPIQVIPHQTFTPQQLQTDQACSAEINSEHINLSDLFEAKDVTLDQPELEPSPKTQPSTEPQPTYESQPQNSPQPSPPTFT